MSCANNHCTERTHSYLQPGLNYIIVYVCCTCFPILFSFIMLFFVPIFLFCVCICSSEKERYMFKLTISRYVIGLNYDGANMFVLVLTNRNK